MLNFGAVLLQWYTGICFTFGQVWDHKDQGEWSDIWDTEVWGRARGVEQGPAAHLSTVCVSIIEGQREGNCKCYRGSMRGKLRGDLPPTCLSNSFIKCLFLWGPVSTITSWIHCLSLLPRLQWSEEVPGPCAGLSPGEQREEADDLWPVLPGSGQHFVQESPLRLLSYHLVQHEDLCQQKHKVGRGNSEVCVNN